MEPPGSFGYTCNVFTLNPAFVEIETSDTRSLLEQAHSGDSKAFGEVCRVYETRLLRREAGRQGYLFSVTTKARGC